MRYRRCDFCDRELTEREGYLIGFPDDDIIPFLADKYYHNDICSECLDKLKDGHVTAIWEWFTDDRNDYVRCTRCGYGEEGEIKLGDESPYCPNCGAEMGVKIE